MHEAEQAHAADSPEGADTGAQTVSAGEEGAAADSPITTIEVEVIVGEIPVADDPSRLRWTARCGDPDHDLLGDFETRQEAEQTKADHLQSAHGGAP